MVYFGSARLGPSAGRAVDPSTLLREALHECGVAQLILQQLECGGVLQGVKDVMRFTFWHPRCALCKRI